jgi:hypothetical protein
MQAIKLHFPLKTPNGEVKELSFRRGKAKDMLQAQNQESDAARRELVLMALLCEQCVTVEDLEDLDLADMVNVQVAFQSLFAKPQSGATLASEGTAGKVVPLSAQ